MINGIVNLYKEAGYTSHDVVARMRGIFSQRKIGHTGTLDPEAEGVLPICLGKATKVCDLITEKDKVYECVMYLGQTTDTQDQSGQVLRKRAVTSTAAEIKAVIQGFVGPYAQIPPMYSALKVNGKKLYNLARQGIEIERKARSVQIYDIKIMEIESPRVRLIVSCSKGTYIRTLCHDIGESLGCGAHMSQLKRLKAAGFTVENSFKIDQIEEMVKSNQLQKFLMPIDSIFQNKKKLYVVQEAAMRLYNGNRLLPEFFLQLPAELLDQEEVCVYDHDKRFAGIFTWQETSGDFKPYKLFFE